MVRAQKEWGEPVEQIKRWAAEGRPDLILAALRERPVEGIYRRDWTDLLKKALAKVGEKGVAELIDLAFGEMLWLTVDLLLRAQYEVYEILRRHDTAPYARNTYSYAIDETRLMRVERLHYHVVDLAKAYASIQHTLDLASRRKTKACGSRPKTAKSQEKGRNEREQAA